ncbi:MAG TPA: hypothetical protein VK615_06860 [Candidatus Binatia bacterium]|nr:hypothetical protein [Candidatus Binatia bacterium]
MLTRALFLAAQTIDPIAPELTGRETSRLFGLNVRDIMLLVAVAAFIGSALFLWAYLSRRDRRRHLARSPHSVDRIERPSRDSGQDRTRVRKRRREHPDNLPRNPTLGETGGLPPLRPDEPAHPAA